MAFNSEIKGYMTFGKSFSRGGAFPLEAYEIWTDYDALVAYAANTDPAKDPSYIGQKVAYVDIANNKVTHYSIEIDGSLKELGAATNGDGFTIDLENGVLSLHGINDEATVAGMLPQVEVTDGKKGIKWVPISEVVQGDGNKITTLTSSDGSVIIEATTDTDNSLVYDLKVTHPAIPVYAITSERNEDDNATVYHLTKDGTNVEKEIIVPDAYDDTALAGRVKTLEDAGYQTATDVSGAIETAIANKAEKATTLAGYGITDAYTKTEVDTALGDKADADDLTELAEKVEAFLTGDGTEAALDSLKELIKYIEEHDDVELADIIADIEALQTKVDTGDQKVSEYVAAAIAALKIGDYAKAADLTALAGRVEVLEAKPFDTYATKDEVNAKADASALDGYYNKDQIDSALQNYVTTGNFNDSIDQLNDAIETISITHATKDELSEHAEAAAETYATKDELKATDDVAKDAQNRVGIVEGKIDEITSVGGEPNVIEKIKVNGVTLEVEKDSEGKSTKTVSISVPTSIVGMDGYSALDGRVTANANSITALEGQLGTTNTNVSGITTRLAALEAEVGEVAESRIDALEGVTAQHTTDIAANTAAITTINTTTIPALEAAIAAETKAREDADKAINEKIGTVESGKTVVDMINAVAGTIDFTPYATKKEVSENYATIAALEAIYKVTGEGESAVATGALATEIARATAAEKSLDDAIKLLTDGAGTSEIDSVKELIDYVNDHGATVEGINDRLDGHDTLLAGIGGTDQPATVVAAIEAAKNEAIAAIPALAIADANTLGGVKSAADVVNGEVTSVATNKVYVDATSAVGEVKAISTDILVNGSEELILFGGNAGVNS